MKYSLCLFIIVLFLNNEMINSALLKSTKEQIIKNLEKGLTITETAKENTLTSKSNNVKDLLGNMNLDKDSINDQEKKINEEFKNTESLKNIIKSKDDIDLSNIDDLDELLKEDEKESKNKKIKIKKKPVDKIEKEDLSLLNNADLLKSLKSKSNDEIDEIMKKYGITNKELGFLKQDANKNNSKAAINLGFELSDSNNPLSEKELQNEEQLSNMNLSNEDIYNIISLFKDRDLFYQAPISAKNLIRRVLNNTKYNEFSDFYQKQLSSSNKSESKFFNASNTFDSNENKIRAKFMKNTLNSEYFQDTFQMIGRKGLLTLIQNSSIKEVWAVLNSKVLTFYETKDYLNIIKTIRLSNVKQLHYDLSSSCFSVNEFVLCLSNENECKLWVDSIKMLKDKVIKKKN